MIALHGTRLHGKFTRLHGKFSMTFQEETRDQNQDAALIHTKADADKLS